MIEMICTCRQHRSGRGSIEMRTPPSKWNRDMETAAVADHPHTIFEMKSQRVQTKIVSAIVRACIIQQRPIDGISWWKWIRKRCVWSHELSTVYRGYSLMPCLTALFHFEKGVWGERI